MNISLSIQKQTYPVFHLNNQLTDLSVRRKVCQCKAELSTLTQALVKHFTEPTLSYVQPEANKDGQLVRLVSSSLGCCRLI